MKTLSRHAPLPMAILASRSTLMKVRLVNFAPWTPFYVSSGDVGLVDGALPSGDELERFASDVAFDAVDRLKLGMAFGNPLGDVGFRPRVRPQPSDSDDVERAVGGSIAAAVEPMAHCLARRGGDGTHAAECCKAGLRAQPLGVVAFNPIKLAFAKLKTILRAVAARTITDLWNTITNAFKRFTPDECRNYLAAAGYDAYDPT